MCNLIRKIAIVFSLYAMLSESDDKSETCMHAMTRKKEEGTRNHSLDSQLESDESNNARPSALQHEISVWSRGLESFEAFMEARIDLATQGERHQACSEREHASTSPVAY